MHKYTLIIFGLLFVNLVAAQENAIKISRQSSDKEIIIKENKRIKIRTTDGQKISGRYRIEGQTIVLKDQIFELKDIEAIKRNPVLVSIFSTGFLIYGGALVAGLGAIIGTFVNPAAYLLIIPGAAIIYAGIKSPNFNKNYEQEDDWTYTLINGSP